ncbi:MAG: VCBS repeat-containing protein [Lachnospiraceae bacterium]|nr:VCBS repeat-containing protein [Lachnospiraceae bacterium]
MALFFADESGKILYKTEQLETNHRNRGQMEQPNRGIAAISFQDVNGDERMDVVLITSCVNDSGAYAGKSYKVGDVLFQSENEVLFYRDYRISDKINRFGMNKSVEAITAFVRDGYSTEFMYTATTLDELQKNGLQIIEEQCYTRSFAKLGKLLVVPGIYRISDYDVFMIYLVNEQGYIVSGLQPMGDFDNLYALKGINCRDIDGDGLKDIVVLARYSYEGAEGQLMVESDYSIYYQRTGGFSADTEIKSKYQCTDEDTMEALVEKARAYWGWKTEK